MRPVALARSRSSIGASLGDAPGEEGGSGHAAKQAAHRAKGGSNVVHGTALRNQPLEGGDNIGCV